MGTTNFDPELLSDFLTESGELLERLDQDLVTLESAPDDPELINQVFRALHTIKGSASFLALTNLVAIAHAAESALNAARNRVVRVDRPMMDLLLAAVDIVKKQMSQLGAGEDLVAADAALVAGLTSLGEGKQASAKAPAATSSPAASAAPVSAPSAPAPSAASAPSGVAPSPAAAGASQSVALPANKADLLEYFVDDVNTSLDQIATHIAAYASDASRPAAASALLDSVEALLKAVDFFEFASMRAPVEALHRLGENPGDLPPAGVASACAAAGELLAVLRQQAQGLAQKQMISVPCDSALARIAAAFEMHDAGAPSTPGSSGASSAASSAALAPNDAPRITPGTPAEPADRIGSPSSSPSASAPVNPASDKPADKAGEKGAEKAATIEQTIRVEVSRLEALLNLVGELVLQKNRVSALSRQLLAQGLGNQEYREAVAETAFSLDRVTSDLQSAVMKTRMQPLDKLFGKYPRLVRDLARKLNKQINLVIEGGDTEVDKSVIEELGDPLVHLMRNSADHGIETPDVRRAAGKPETGTIRLSASNAGGHVEIRISDDGRGLSRDKLGAKAVEKGLVSAGELAQLSDQQVYRFIFAAGFSTADQISDVSGRGVGMDVVRTNIEKIKGTIDLETKPGSGTTVVIRIPLTVAIMNAMMVGTGNEIYAVPLSSVIEIVKPQAEHLGSVNQRPVLRLRETVLPLLDAAELFRQPQAARDQARFAVVLSQGDERIGLMVSRLIGQQEIVIKPLDELLDKEGGPVSGATVRDDGGVSLIVDVARLFSLATGRHSSVVSQDPSASKSPSPAGLA